METNMNLEQHFASVVRYIQSHVEVSSSIFFDDFPQNFAVPGLYFPVPRSSSRKVTFETYRTDISMEIWFLASSNEEALKMASNVSECILLDDCKMELMEKDGTLSHGYVVVSEPSLQPGDTGIHKMTFKLTYYISRSREKKKANNITFSGLIKADALYQAWYAATEEQRKDEEVQKACLQKAMQQIL